jgi:Rrf2 family protein
MMWPGFPKRLHSALKALGCLGQAGRAMQAPAIADEINVSKAETAKIMQLLVWGGFVSSRRGTKGGFQLAMPAERITMGEVIDFFLARHPEKPDLSSPVMRALTECLSAGQQKFAELTVAQVVHSRKARRRGSSSASGTNQTRKKSPKANVSPISTPKRRSQHNAQYTQQDRS